MHYLTCKANPKEPAMNPEPMAMNDLPCDVSRKFVRVLQRRGNGLVEFEFSIG